MATVQGAFGGGEVREISPTPLPTASTMFSRIENAYIEEDTTLRVRNPFRRINTSTPITKAPNYFTAKVFSYPSVPSPYHDKILIIQFGALKSGSQLARTTTYSLIDADTGQLLKSNQPFLSSGDDKFYPEHFDLLILRSANSEGTEDADRFFYALGGKVLYRFKINSAGTITSVTIPGNAGSFSISHPYAGTQFGAFLPMMCWSVLAGSGGSFNDSRAFGTRVALFNLNSQNNQQTSINLHLRAGERILRSASFAESVFFVTNQGLRGLTFVDTTSITATNVVERKISSFSGRDVAPRALHANFLYYGGDEVRVRDISSLQANIVQAGDFIANAVKEPILPVKSGILFGEDTLLFLQEDRRTFKALSNVFAEGRVTHPVTTFYVSDEDVLDFYTEESSNWFYMTEGDTELFVTEYNSRSTPTETSIPVTLTTGQYSLVSSQNKMRINIDKQGFEFTFVPGNRYNYNRANKAILSITGTVGDRRFSGPMSLSFGATGGMQILLAQLWFETFAES